MSGERILVVDDEADIRGLIAKYLKKEMMDVTQAESGTKALTLLERNKYDLVILDLMMKGLDGFETLKHIREKDKTLHVMIVSAREEDYDKILGLGLGADDYVTKPFSPGELVARIKSQLRRLKVSRGDNAAQDEILTSGDFILNRKAHKAFCAGRELGLSSREFRLLELFLENPGRVFTKQQIYAAAWDDDYFDENTVMVYINHVRNKIETNPGQPRYIVTVWGIGYRYDPGSGKNDKDAKSTKKVKGKR